MRTLLRFFALCLLVLPASAQPAVKAFITLNDMVRANPFQVADPTPSGTRTATVSVQNPAGMYALTNTWSGTNTSTLIASSTPDWAWQLLSMASGPTLYTSDGALNTPRVVNLDSKSLTWQGPGAISNNVNSFKINANEDIVLKSFSILDLAPSQQLTFHTPSIAGANRTARQNDVLTLLNVSTGEADFRTLPGQTNIYNADGTLTTNRWLKLDARNLTVQGPGSALFESLDTFSVAANQFARVSSPGNVILESPGFMTIRTPNVVAGGAQPAQVLTLMAANGQVEFAPVPGAQAPTNIYNSDGTLTGNRTVGMTNFGLTFSGQNLFRVATPANLELTGTNTTIGGRAGLFVKTPNTWVSAGIANQVLALQDPATGRAEFVTPTPLPTLNIYNSDGTLSSNRKLEGNNLNLTFTNVSNFGVGAQQTILSGASALMFRTPKVRNSQATTNQFLALNNADGTVDFRDLPTPTVDTSIYNTNGYLFGNRTVDMAGKNLDFVGYATERFQIYNPASIALYSKTNTIFTTEELLMGTGGGRLKLFNNATASRPVGSVLSLQNPASGLVDYVPFTNLYTADGIIQDNRNVNLGGRSLTFTGAGSRFDVNAIQTAGVSADTNVLWAFTNLVVGAGKRFQLRTPKQIESQAIQGHVLTLLSSADGDADYMPAPTLYNTNGTIVSDRIVEGQFRDLSLTNMKHLSMRGWTSTLSGSVQLNVRTPKVGDASAATNQVLTLLDVASGRSEFMPLPAPIPDVNLYTNDGTINSTLRTITIPTDRTLRMFGAGTTLLNTDINQLSAKTNYMLGSERTTIGANNTFQMRTPRFYNALAKDGDVLTMVNRGLGLGETDYYPPSNLYNNNGTLTGHRTVTGGNFDMLFGGLRAFQVAVGTDIRLYCNAAGQLILATPKIMGSGASPAPVAGFVLTLKNAASGQAEWEPAPNQPGIGDTSSIYANDGNILTNLVNDTRTVNFSTKRLLFLGGQSPTTGGAFDVATENNGNGRVSLSAATNSFYASKRMELGGAVSTVIQTPGTYANAASRAGWVLQWDGAKSEYVPLAAGQDVNIYSTNGTLSGHRTLSGANNDLTLGGIRNLWLEGGTSLKLVTPKVVSGHADRAIGHVATMTGIDGSFDWQAPSDSSIYNSNGGMIGVNPRQITGNNWTLLWTGFNSYEIDSQTTTLWGRTSLKLRPPGTPVAGQVLTATAADGSSVWQDLPAAPTTLYTGNGTLVGAGDRAVTLNSKTLNFNGPGNVNVASVGTFDVLASTRANLLSSGTMKLQANTRFELASPRVAGSAAVAGQVLTLQADGSSDFFPVTPPSVVTFYSGNGDLNGNRDVNGNNHYLKFNSVSEFMANATTVANLTSLGSTLVYGNTATVNGVSQVTISAPTTVIEGTTSLRIKPGNISTANNNDVLTLVDKATGRVEYKPVQPGGGGVGYTGDAIDNGPGTAPASMSFAVANVSPTYAGGPYPFGTRLTVRLSRPNGSGWDNTGTGSIYMQMGGGPSEAVYPPDGNNPAAGQMKEGVIMDLVFTKNVGNTGFNGWVFVNAGWTSTQNTLMANATLSITNSVTRRVSSLSVVGVVDTFEDLAGVPMTFKKVSTLGRVTIGDGQHGDYYLTQFIPETLQSIRSTVDPARMWRKLIPQP